MYRCELQCTVSACARVSIRIIVIVQLKTEDGWTRTYTHTHSLTYFPDVPSTLNIASRMSPSFVVAPFTVCPRVPIACRVNTVVVEY